MHSRKTFWSVAAIAVIIAGLSAPASASMLKITLDVDPGVLEPGFVGEFDLRIFAEVSGTGGVATYEHGLHTTSIDVTSVGGLSAAVQLFPPPASGKVKTTWGPDTGDFTRIVPTWVDMNGDAKQDARAMLFGTLGFSTYYTFGYYGPQLVATQVWNKTAAGALELDVEVSTASSYVNWVDPTNTDNYTSFFTEVEGVGISGAPPEGTPPNADADGPYELADWTGGPSGASGWNNPLRQIILDGSATAATDGDPILNFTWEITNTHDPLHPVTIVDAGASDTKVITIAMLAADGDLPDDYYEAMASPFGVVLKATDKDGIGTSDPTDLFVPEPGTMALLAFAGLAALSRRRKRS